MKTRARKRNDAYLVERLLQSGAFRTVLDLDFVYVANEINNLTAACSPSLFRRAGECKVDFDILLTVIDEPLAGEQALERNLKREGGYIALKRSVPLNQWRDVLIIDDRLSDGLIGYIAAELQRYTLGVREALALVAGQDDRFISGLKSVFGSRFDDIILYPLMEIAKH